MRKLVYCINGLSFDTLAQAKAISKAANSCYTTKLVTVEKHDKPSKEVYEKRKKYFQEKRKKGLTNKSISDKIINVK